MPESLPFTKIVRGLPSFIPFVGPETIEREKGRPFELRIGANESAFGISPMAREAMCGAVDQVSWYNDPENHDLREALGQIHGVSPKAVCVSAGIDDLLGLVVRALVEPGDPVVSCRGSYPTFAYHVQGFAGRQEQVPYLNDRCDLDGLASKVRETGAHLVYVANPDNPMGTWHAASALAAFVSQLPEDCVAVIDEAYVDFAPPEALWDMNPEHPRVIRMRTFSKAHGMAGARVGYAVAHADMVAGLEKVRNHFGVNKVAQAGALASLEDTTFVEGVAAQVDAGRLHYAELAAGLGLPSVPSGTNFVCIDLGSGERARAAQGALMERDVFVRMPSLPPQDRCIRVTVGTEAERSRFADLFTEVVEEVRL